MKRQQRPSLLALSAVLLCTLQQGCGSSTTHGRSASSTSPSEVRGRNNLGEPTKQTSTHSNYTFGSHRHGSRLRPKLQPAYVNNLNTSRDNVTTVIPERSDRPNWGPDEGVSPLCAYRVTEGGIGGPLCFRHTQLGYKCPRGDCRTVVSLGTLVANIHSNGTVLLQWTHKGGYAIAAQGEKTKETAAEQGRVEDIGGDLKGQEPPVSHTVFNGRHHRKAGYELRCWWNGSYTQFECAGVHLGSGCRDFLLTELHENIPYRICLRSRSDPAQRTDQGDCVEFTLPPSGMQDIVIAMTTVGGAICVMLVIICLLVAYITENIMSPATQHTYSYRSHSH
ncbi:fibronectin type III domain-containing protein 10 [Genypterus blacodes]|uniref:fibronectin type III domain-containing protein 10 n=1 Tax=Genypterus blacodes TaxID=154954 RepID=UPI003F7574BE